MSGASICIAMLILPTVPNVPVQGIMRRGLRIEALQEFILQQVSSVAQSQNIVPCGIVLHGLDASVDEWHGSVLETHMGQSFHAAPEGALARTHAHKKSSAHIVSCYKRTCHFIAQLPPKAKDDMNL